MTFKARVIFVLAWVALAANAAAANSEPRNLILFIPEALPATVEPGLAPTLSQLRDDGVHFTNSHSGFPRLKSDDLTAVAPDLRVLSLVDAASRKYVTSFLYDERAPGQAEVGPELGVFLANRLPAIKQGGRPFFLVYRLIEPRSSPPENGEARRAYKADPRAADAALKAIESALKALHLASSTNIVVTGEHGLARTMKVSNTSSARSVMPRQDTLGTLPPGFLAIDLLAALQTEDFAYNLFDTDNSGALVHLKSHQHPKQGNAFIAMDYDVDNPYVTIEAHGVYDTVALADSLTRSERRAAARRIVEALLEQDYVGAIFANETRVGSIPGTLPVSRIAAETGDEPTADIVVVFASMSEGCVQPLTCMSVIADTPLDEGEGIANSFSRGGTSIFMAARSPDFQNEFIDRAPASNADIARTIAELLDVELSLSSETKGRVLSESLATARKTGAPRAQKQVIDSVAAEDGSVTRVTLQFMGPIAYFDGALHTNQDRMALAVKSGPRWHWPRVKRFTITLSDKDD